MSVGRVKTTCIREHWRAFCQPWCVWETAITCCDGKREDMPKMEGFESKTIANTFSSAASDFIHLFLNFSILLHCRWTPKWQIDHHVWHKKSYQLSCSLLLLVWYGMASASSWIQYILVSWYYLWWHFFSGSLWCNLRGEDMVNCILFCFSLPFLMHAHKLCLFMWSCYHFELYLTSQVNGCCRASEVYW